MAAIESKRISNCQRHIPVHVEFTDRGTPIDVINIIKSDVSPCIAEIPDLKLIPARRKSFERVVKCQIAGCLYFGKLKKEKVLPLTSDLDPLDTEPPFLIT